MSVPLLLLSGCKDKPAQRDDASVIRTVGDAAAVVEPADAGVWPELANLPNVEPVRVIALPVKAGTPRFTIAGPVLLGDLAIVASSQFGFLAVDWRRGQIAWSKPAGMHVAPPVVVDGNVVLIGSCIHPPQVPDGETLLGCMRVVTPTGADQAYLAIRGEGLEEHDASTGEQRVWRAKASGKDAAKQKAKERIVWRRGESAVAIDPMSGVAKATSAEDPPLVVAHEGKTWRIRRTEDGTIDAKGTPSWRTEESYGRLLGAVHIPEQGPMVRVASAIMHAGAPEILIFDMDATGSLHGQVSLSPVPGIAVTSHANDPVGDVALAVRLDKSLQRDYIAGFAANALLMWTYPLPQMLRPDPVGIAMAPDAVVVFHDGDTLTVLPEVSAPPTAPGAVRAPSENATP